MGKNIAIIILAIVAIGAGAAAFNFQKQLKERDEAVAALEMSIADMESQEMELKESLRSAQKQLVEDREKLGARASEMEQALDAKNDQIASLREEAESIREKLSSIEEEAQSWEDAASEYASTVERLEQTLTDRNQTIDSLESKVSGLQSNLESARESLRALRSEANATMDETAAEGGEPKMELPIALTSSNAGFFGSNRIVAVENRSDTTWELTVTHTGSSGENRSEKELNVPAQGTATLGEKEWKLKPGDRLSFAHADFKTMTYTIP